MDKRNRQRKDSAGTPLSQLKGADAISTAQARALKRTLKLQKRALENATKYPTDRAICAKSGISTKTLYRWQRFDDDFRAAYEEAKEKFGDSLEEIVVDRVVNGVLSPVVSAGKLVTYERKYSDRLTEVALRGRNKRYNDRTVPATAIAGIAGGYERLAARLRLIADRRRARAVPGADDK